MAEPPRMRPKEARLLEFFRTKPTSDGKSPLAANNLFTNDSLHALASNEIDVDCHFQTLTSSSFFTN